MMRLITHLCAWLIDRCDGNEIIGFRLYKEVNTSTKNETPPTISCQWETLATNLEEFQKVVVSWIKVNLVYKSLVK